jgi:8-oxo-dGTP diphosphatase
MNSIKKVHDSETSAHGQQVITACAFIYYDFDGVIKVFMPKRADTKKFLPSVHELPGGHIDYGEDIIDGLKREIKEEVDMDIDILDIFDAATYVNEIKGAHAIQVTYFANFVGDITNIVFNPEDHSGYSWVQENEIDRIVEENKKGEDMEMLTLRKGFKILREK